MTARRKRTTPSRSSPIRNATSAEALLRGILPGPAAATVDRGLKAAGQLAESANAAVLGVVERGVETAYMVIDEYMERGRAAATGHYNRGDSMSKRNRGSDEYRYGYGGPWSTAGVFGPWFQVARMWNDAMWQFVPGTCGPSSYSSPSSRRGWEDEYCGGRVSVEVSSSRPIKVSADLDPDCYGDDLSVDDLVNKDDSSKVIKGVEIECTNGRVYVHVKVDNTHAKGEYKGAIRDDDDRRRGKVWVVIEPEKDGDGKGKGTHGA